MHGNVAQRSMKNEQPGSSLPKSSRKGAILVIAFSVHCPEGDEKELPNRAAAFAFVRDGLPPHKLHRSPPVSMQLWDHKSRQVFARYYNRYPGKRGGLKLKHPIETGRC